jgi:hypothetical protein
MEVLKARTVGNNAFTSIAKSNGTPTSQSGILRETGEVAQSITTADHPVHLLNKERVQDDIGGAFYSTKVELKADLAPNWHKYVGSGIGGYDYEFFTALVPHVEVAQIALGIGAAKTRSQITSLLGTRVPVGFSIVEMNAMGSKAISMLSPLNPVADTATTFAEFLAERKFFKLPGTAGSLPGEYLNYMFGVAPTVSYAQELRGAIGNRDQHLDQLHRDSGRWIRRRGTILEDASNTYTKNSSASPAGVGQSVNFQIAPTGQLHTWTEVQRKVWFSGAFTYHLPKPGEMRRLAELDKLYGVKPGVDTAWELLPYSWLVDYKFSAGAVLKNLNSFGSDGLVMPYGYLMGSKKTTIDYRYEGAIRDATGNYVQATLTATVVKTTKQRVRANPFGFGILPGALSARQLSILAALGLSRFMQ